MPTRVRRWVINPGLENIDAEQHRGGSMASFVPSQAHMMLRVGGTAGRPRAEYRGARPSWRAKADALPRLSAAR